MKLPLTDPAMCDPATLLHGLEEFREHLGGRLCITLLKGIGQGYEVNSIDQSAMRTAIEQLAADR